MATICKPLLALSLILSFCNFSFSQQKNNFKADKALLQTIRQNITDA